MITCEKGENVNGKNLNVRYRRNAYAKTRIKIIVTVLVTLLVVALVAFLVIGGMLDSKVTADRNNQISGETQDAENATPHAEVASVKGYGVTLSGATTTTITDKATEISKAGGSNISFVVRDNSGKELYSSALAQSMGKQSAGSYIDITDVESKASAKGLSSSAIVPIYSFAKKDNVERATQLFYDAAICVESFREGADDVLIKLEGTEITDKNIEELLRFATWVKDLDSSVILGIALTKDMLSKEGAELLVGKLYEKYDFLALDLTTLKSGESISQNGNNNEIQFYLLMYKMRVLLPNVAGDDLKAIVSEIESMNVYNWQTVVQ